MEIKINMGKDFSRNTIEISGRTDPGSFIAFSGVDYDWYAYGGKIFLTENDVSFLWLLTFVLYQRLLFGELLLFWQHLWISNDWPINVLFVFRLLRNWKHTTATQIWVSCTPGIMEKKSTRKSTFPRQPMLQTPIWPSPWVYRGCDVYLGLK